VTNLSSESVRSEILHSLSLLLHDTLLSPSANQQSSVTALIFVPYSVLR
jgi:hypothetical protein